MSVTINIDPVGVDVKEIPGPADENGNPTVAAVILAFHDPAMGVSIGPFDPEGWARFVEYLGDPAGVSEKQRIRERIAVANGGQMPPKMAVPKG